MYTFNSIAFSRLISGEFAPWFARKSLYTQSAVLDSGQEYVDIGATSYEPLTIRACLFDRADSEALAASLGTTAVLANSRSQSQDALLAGVTPVDLGLAGYYVLDLTFLWRPTGSAA